jgi:hypothetical protein
VACSHLAWIAVDPRPDAFLAWHSIFVVEVETAVAISNTAIGYSALDGFERDPIARTVIDAYRMPSEPHGPAKHLRDRVDNVEQKVASSASRLGQPSSAPPL